MNISINRVTSPEDLQHCFAIRCKVFVEGQNVPLAEEMDGNDETSNHYLLCIDEQPAGVARVRFIEDYAKIERVAIMDDYQGKGLGHKLMDYILTELKHLKTIKKAKLSSQTYAIPFYEKLGFTVCSEEYLDANIPHKDMILSFT
ncbi:MAG: GNAT family N-acetyltransferase [Legionella sp.]|nr:MAG: GNAT family N-acetyltransferase [Legionella sp.]